MAGNQLQAKIKEASKVLSRKFSKREGISINREEEMGLIEEQQLEAKSEERNSGMRYSIGEDASTHSKNEIGLKKVQQLQENFEEANRVLSGKFSSREDISINIEEEMGLIEEQQMETKFEEANIGVLRNRSNKEDIMINVEEEIELIEDQQRRRVQESGAEDISTSSPPSEEKFDVIASKSQNNQLVSVMKGMLDEIKPSLSSKYCIYRIAQPLRELNKEAFEPRVISFGPLHHGDARFKSMEAFKMRYFKNLVQRNSTRVGLEKYIEFLKDQEENVRQCYSEIIEMGSDDFLKMLLLDSCFIIELLLRWNYRNFRDEDHFVLTSPRLWHYLRYDLILLENQIPFFILDGLYNLSMTGWDQIPLLNLAIPFFRYYNTQKKTPDDINSIMHFTDLMLIFLRPMSPRIIDPQEVITTNTATELDEAGVKFLMSSSICMFDIKFTSNGVLEIPRFSLYDNTESLIRNLIALELCHYPHSSYVIDYFLFMDYLVNTSKDVDLLVQSGIVKNGLGDNKKVAALYNNLCTNIAIHNYNYSSLSEELNMYCKSRWHRYRAALKREYFSTPWRSASTSAAIILLFLTSIQTICSLISVATYK